VDEAAVRRRLAILYGVDVTWWELLATYPVTHALPAMPAPHEFRKPVRMDGLYVCGDHRDTSSIQGALVSGRRVARAVLADLIAAGSVPAPR
jgi:predicted NAD/FAD-dependent oxidoreductase